MRIFGERYKMIYAAAITGPTASGKTALSVRVAKALGATIFSADSMQIYKEMSIGTAKIRPEEMEGVPHKMLDIASVREDFSTHAYKEMALAEAKNVIDGGSMPLFVGGTGLYLSTLTRREEELTPGRSEEYMRLYEAEAATEEGRERLHARLAQVDPESAIVIHKNNVRRVLRALEIFDTTGKTKTAWDKESREGEGAVSLCHVTLDFKSRELLYSRIDRRVRQMMEEGLLCEVESLYKQGLLTAGTASGAIGYKEFLPYFRGECSLSDVEEAICLGTRHYAKRQQTWFRRLADVKTVYMDTDAGNMRPFDEVFEETMEHLAPFARAHYAHCK